MSELTVRTEPSKSYIPPTRNMLRKTGEGYEIREDDLDFSIVSDITNVASGGKVRSPSEYLPAVSAEAAEEARSEGFTGARMREVASAKTQEKMKYNQQVGEFLESLDLNVYPGKTPMHKAMNCVYLLKKKSEQEGGKGNGDGLQIFKQSGGGQKAAEELQELMQKVNGMDEAMQDLMDGDAPSSGNQGEHNEVLKRMRIAEKMIKGEELLVDIARKIEEMTKMRVRRSKEYIYDPDGTEVRTRPIQDMNELSKLVKTEWALPSVYRLYRVVSRASRIREKVSPIEKKQLLYMIVDCSGSMGDMERIYKAGGIMMNRLAAVLRGDAELYIRFFDTSLHTEHFVQTEEEARKIMKMINMENFSGGGTSIDRCLRGAHARIEELMKQGLHVRPELAIVTDGCDRVHITQRQISGTKLHAFVVDGDNPPLVKLAIQTGGVGYSRL